MIRLAFPNLRLILQFWHLALAILKKKHESSRALVLSLVQRTLIAMEFETILHINCKFYIQLHAVEGND